MLISWDSAPCIFVSFSFPSLERVVLYTGSAYAQNKLITSRYNMLVSYILNCFFLQPFLPSFFSLSAVNSGGI